VSNEFSIGERKFKVNKIDAFKQFHIVRRIGPILAEFVKSAGGITNVKVDDLKDNEKLEQFAKIAEPIMKGLSSLSDADADYVLMNLLAGVEVHQPQFNMWAKVSNGTVIAMQDIDLPVLLQCAGRSLMFNLSGFFTMLPRG